jgi:hypothetical protein
VTYKVEFYGSAKADVTEAVRWYRARERSLGLRFRERLKEAADKIRFMPLGYAKQPNGLRSVGMNVFPTACGTCWKTTTRWLSCSFSTSAATRPW